VNRFLLMIILLTLPNLTQLCVGIPDIGTGSTNHYHYVLENLSFDFSNLVNGQDNEDKLGSFDPTPYLVVVILSLIKVRFIQVHLHKIRTFLLAVFYQSNYVKVAPLNQQF
jgi:hypothetical protein